MVTIRPMHLVPRFRQSAPSLADLPRLRIPLGIGRRNSPEIVVVVGKLLAQFQAEMAVGIRCRLRIFEVISKRVALAAKIEPGLGILMNKQRGKRTDIAKTVEFEFSTLPGIPHL